MKRLALLLSVVFALLVLALLTLVDIEARTSRAAGLYSGSYDEKGAAAPSACGSSWSSVTSANVSGQNNYLYAVSGGPTNMWAVGARVNTSNARQTLTQHWDGHNWATVASPNPNATNSVLWGVSTFGTDDAWAVGWYHDASASTEYAFTLHWNGIQWAMVDLPNIGAHASYLYGVVAVSPSNVWAVGGYYDTGLRELALVLRWDGSRWVQVTTPNGENFNQLHGITALPNGDLWSVGRTATGGTYQTLVLHWDAYTAQWTRVTSPNRGTGHNVLQSVAAVTSDDMWAVGNSDGLTRTLVEHWNGTNWTIFASPSSSVYSTLDSVSALSTDDVWAVGGSNAGADNQALIEHWDGTSWSMVPGVAAYNSSLRGVVAIRPGDVWAAGSYSNASLNLGQTLVERHQPCAAVDSDGDGIPDDWELHGTTITPPGGTPQLINLPAMGADPNKPDIFLQIDWMYGTLHNHKLNKEAIRRAVEAFANSPYVSPTGSHGINLHVDEGPGSVLNYGTNTTWGSLSHAQGIADVDLLGSWGSHGYDWHAFQAYKSANFIPTGRSSIFHYVISAVHIGTGDLDRSGISRGNPSSDFIVSLDGFSALPFGTTTLEATTLMHELGHNLGLRHGGGDEINYKPNYLSVMNYSFQDGGLIKPGSSLIVDYSRSALDVLNEASLSEPSGLGAGAAGFGTEYYCPDGRKITVAYGPGPIDWNCNGSSTEVGVAADVNHDLAAGEVLTGFNDWSHIQLIGGSIGALGAPLQLPDTTVQPDELTQAELAPVQACAIEFSDVLPGSTFYSYVHCLACQSILGGYSDGTFGPGRPVSRGQLAKIVANSAGFDDQPTGQSFEDVAQGSTFYDFIERLASREVIGGYPCGGPGEPCGTGNRPYFRPNADVTRGQISKIVAIAADLSDPLGTQVFQDVPEGSTFYEYVQRLVNRAVMSGYACGSPGEPCISPGNKPYFRPNASATRGQVAKIVANLNAFCSP